MGRGAWRAIVHGVAESEMTERPTLSLYKVPMNQKQDPRSPNHIPYPIFSNQRVPEKKNFFSFWPHQVTCRTLVPQPMGVIKPMAPALGALAES